MARLSEELLDRDVDNAASKVTFDSIFSVRFLDIQVELDLGCTTRSGNPRDCSPRPLFKRFLCCYLLYFLLEILLLQICSLRLDQSLLRRPVYSKLLALYNNYDVSNAMLQCCDPTFDIEGGHHEYGDGYSQRAP